MFQEILRRGLLVVVPLVLTCAAGTMNATPLTYGISGTFGNSLGGIFDNGSFSGTYVIPTLPLAPNTTNSYEILNTFDVVLKKGSTTVEFTPGLNSSGAYFSSQYESSEGTDFLDFYDSKGDTFTLYFAPGFTGVGNVLPTVTKQ
jgi:hypothetical protein